MATNHKNTALSTLNLKEKVALCNTWQKSGISRSEFIRRNNLPKSFHYWCNKLLSKGLYELNIKAEHAVDNAETNKNSQKLPDNTLWMQVIPTLTTNNTEEQNKNNVHAEKVKVKLIVNAVTLTLNMSHLQIVALIKELSNADTTIR